MARAPVQIPGVIPLDLDLAGLNAVVRDLQRQLLAEQQEVNGLRSQLDASKRKIDGLASYVNMLKPFLQVDQGNLIVQNNLTVNGDHTVQGDMHAGGDVILD